MTTVDRFLKYVSFDTQSDEESETCPSTAKQKNLGEYLVGELQGLGIANARMDEHGYVYAFIEATAQNAPAIGFISHMDTSPECSGANIRARIVEYNGGDIVLNEEKNVVMRESYFPSLTENRGKHLIVTDGTTLLGADDKAGIAEIVTMAEQLLQSSIPHGRLCLAFTPDEEVGRGADLFDVPGFHADYAYTVDGGKLGGIEYETFNAASAKVVFHGVSVHTGDAKDKMKNASLMAIEFNSLLPADEIPSKTEGYEGFFHLCSIESSVENAVLHYIIRDHDMDKFLARKALMESAATAVNEKYGEGAVELTLQDTYYNMRDKILPHMYIVDRAKKAMEENGVTPVITPVRGGTDGSRLSYMGLPCPNLCTGGQNYHGRFEYVPAEDMETITGILLTIVKDAASC